MTIGLCIITKEITSELKAKLYKEVHPYFDEIYIQVNGDGDVRADTAPWGDPKISRYKWNDNFADARNALLKEVKTDYWMWLDSDDEIDGLEHIRSLVADMERQKVDSIMALYEYAQNDQQEQIGTHWKDRILRSNHPWEWKGAVHENPISKGVPRRMKTDQLKIVHHKTEEEFQASIERNHKILVAQVLDGDAIKDDADPRDVYYLAMSYFTKGDYANSIELFVELTKISGNPEDVYSAWIKIAECHQKLNNLDLAIDACMEAVKIEPEWPEAYFELCFVYYELDEMEKSLEWNKVGMTKSEPVDRLGIYDATLRYRAMMFGALAELSKGRVKDAWELINAVKTVSPKYPLMLKYYPLFETAYYESKALDYAKWLIQYASENKGHPERIISALGNLGMDVRLNPERAKLFPPKKWPPKSIVFFCGAGLESWGPDTLEKGMGGSEEAVTYLSKELAKLGWQVTVFNDREKDYLDYTPGMSLTENLETGAVTNDTRLYPVFWKPWHLFNPKDEFDVIIAWRNPKFFTAYDIKARVKGVDLHDTPIGHQNVNEEDVKHTDKYFFKSQMQREMAKFVSDDQVVIASNGINKDEFDV